VVGYGASHPPYAATASRCGGQVQLSLGKGHKRREILAGGGRALAALICGDHVWQRTINCMLKRALAKAGINSKVSDWTSFFVRWHGPDPPHLQ
jgi:hypothetical protein